MAIRIAATRHVECCLLTISRGIMEVNQKGVTSFYIFNIWIYKLKENKLYKLCKILVICQQNGTF